MGAFTGKVFIKMMNSNMPRRLNLKTLFQIYLLVRGVIIQTLGQIVLAPILEETLKANGQVTNTLVNLLMVVLMERAPTIF